MAVSPARRGRGGRRPKPLIAVRETDIGEADRLLALWRHPLPLASRRRFGRMSFRLKVYWSWY